MPDAPNISSPVMCLVDPLLYNQGYKIAKGFLALHKVNKTAYITFVLYIIICSSISKQPYLPFSQVLAMAY